MKTFFLALTLALTSGAAFATPLGTMIVHKDPNCGCCKVWAEAMAKEGFEVTISTRADLDVVKQEHNIPQGFEGCHTASVNGYTLEGHVPLEAIRKLLKEKPENLSGLTVGGMPMGSLGMGVDPEASYDVHGLPKDGSAPILYMQIRNNRIVE